MKTSVSFLILLLMISFMLPAIQVAQIQEVKSSKKLPTTVSDFRYAGKYFVKIIADPTKYQTLERNFTLSSYTVEIYHQNLTLDRKIEIPDRYESAFISDINGDLILTNFSNGTNDYYRLIFDRQGNQLLHSSLIPSSIENSSFESITDQMLEVVEIRDSWDQLPEPRFIYNITQYNYTTGHLHAKYNFTVPDLEDNAFGDLREISISSPRKLNSTFYNIKQRATYYGDSVGTTQKMAALDLYFNITSGEVQTNIFESQVCDTSFEDKQNMLEVINFAQGCQFFPDYQNEKIYFTRLMVLDDGTSVLHVTVGDQELAARLDHTFERIDPYFLNYNQSTFSIFFFDFQIFQSGELEYVNVRFNFEDEKIELIHGGREIPSTPYPTFIPNSDHSVVTFYFANLTDIETIIIDIEPQEYVVPTDLYATTSTGSVAFFFLPLLIPVLSQLRRKNEDLI